MMRIPLAIPTPEAEELRGSETRQAFAFAIAFGVFGLFALSLVLGAGWLMEVETSITRLMVGGIVALTLFVVFGILFTGLRRGRGAITFITHKWGELVDFQLDSISEAPLPELPTTAYLPADTPETVQVTTATQSRAVVKELVNGFDPRTLDWVALYLANGNLLSESRLEKMPLPSSEGINWGGLTEGTPLTRICDLCEAKGITSARDGDKRKPGKLLIADEAEIKRLLKST